MERVARLLGKLETAIVHIGLRILTILSFLAFLAFAVFHLYKMFSG